MESPKLNIGIKRPPSPYPSPPFTPFTKKPKPSPVPSLPYPSPESLSPSSCRSNTPPSGDAESFATDTEDDDDDDYYFDVAASNVLPRLRATSQHQIFPTRAFVTQSKKQISDYGSISHTVIPSPSTSEEVKDAIDQACVALGSVLREMTSLMQEEDDFDLVQYSDISEHVGFLKKRIKYVFDGIGVDEEMEFDLLGWLPTILYDTGRREQQPRRKRKRIKIKQTPHHHMRLRSV